LPMRRSPSGRVNHISAPGPINRVVIGRLVMSVEAAQALAVDLFDFLKSRGVPPRGPPRQLCSLTALLRARMPQRAVTADIRTPKRLPCVGSLGSQEMSIAGLSHALGSREMARPVWCGPDPFRGRGSALSWRPPASLHRQHQHRVTEGTSRGGPCRSR
jgi:hypothetical protein